MSSLIVRTAARRTDAVASDVWNFSASARPQRARRRICGWSRRCRRLFVKFVRVRTRGSSARFDRRSVSIDRRGLASGSLEAALLPVLKGKPFLTAQWIAPAMGLGTPLIFDVGVFCVVIGVVLTMTFMLGEE